MIGSIIDYQSKKWKKTPLILASYQGKLETVSYLLENKAKINLTDEHGWTALMYATQQNHFEVIKVLVEKGNANLFLKNNDGHIAEDLADNKLIEDYLQLMSNTQNVQSTSTTSKEEKRKHQDPLMFQSNVFAGLGFLYVISNGKVFSGGSNNCGQLGLNDFQNRSKFEQIKWPLSSFHDPITSISCRNALHVLFVTQKGNIFGCGEGRSLGLGLRSKSRDNFCSITKLSTLTAKGIVHQAFVSFHRSFVVFKNGKVCVFGNNAFGSLGISEKEQLTQGNYIYSPKELNVSSFFIHCTNKHSQEGNIEERIKDIRSGNTYSLILTNLGNIYSCGLGSAISHSKGFSTVFKPIVLPEKQDPVIQISAGSEISLFLTKSHDVFVCGEGKRYSAKKPKVYVPRKLEIYGQKIRKIISGNNFSFFICRKEDRNKMTQGKGKGRRIYAVGNNHYKQLNIYNKFRNEEVSITEPKLVLEDEEEKEKRYVNVFVGGYNSYFINANGFLYSCGINEESSCILTHIHYSPVQSPCKIHSIRVSQLLQPIQTIFQRLYQSLNQSKFVNLIICTSNTP